MNSYTWSDLITYVGQSYPRLQADAAGALLCDMTHGFIWSAADWRQSLATMTPFYLTALTQDYAPPAISVPTDFLGLRSALLTYNGTEPATVYPPLHVVRYLDKTHEQGRIRDICWQSDVGGFRTWPRCPSGVGVMDYQVECTYKKLPTKVTTSTLMTALPFEDQYFRVYVEGLKYFLKPAAQQSDQDLARLYSAVQSMAGNEALNLGDGQPLSPADPLVGW